MRIKSIAAYVFAAVLVVVLTYAARKADGLLFPQYEALRPAEAAAECFAVLVCAVFLFISGKGKKKRFKGNLIFAAVPLLLVFTAYFRVPDVPLTAGHGAEAADLALSCLAEDLVLCAVGCALLAHKAKLRIAAAVMLLFMACYEAVLHEGEPGELPLALLFVCVIGYFEIQLHLITESTVLCAVFHVVFHYCRELLASHSSQPSPYIGDTASYAVYIAAILIMLLSAVFLREKRKVRELEEAWTKEYEDEEKRKTERA